jgi:hypothetical protein
VGPATTPGRTARPTRQPAPRASSR